MNSAAREKSRLDRSARIRSDADLEFDPSPRDAPGVASTGVTESFRTEVPNSSEVGKLGRTRLASPPAPKPIANSSNALTRLPDFIVRSCKLCHQVSQNPVLKARRRRFGTAIPTRCRAPA